MQLKHERAEIDGLVYRVLGPGGKGVMWIARSTTGHVAHGRTPEGAAVGLKAGLSALAEVAGESLGEWLQHQGSDSTRVLCSGELLQAGSRLRDAST